MERKSIWTLNNVSINGFFFVDDNDDGLWTKQGKDMHFNRWNRLYIAYGQHIIFFYGNVIAKWVGLTFFFRNINVSLGYKGSPVHHNLFVTQIIAFQLLVFLYLIGYNGIYMVWLCIFLVK